MKRKKKYKLSFQRYEKKYLLTVGQYEKLFRRMEEHIEPDFYFSSTVCSLYYDTDDYSFIRNSIEKPVYKEKLRLRSYNVPGENDPVFVEIKKKFLGIVYKRRVAMPASKAAAWLNEGVHPDEDSQIIREIDWILKSNTLKPKVFTACERTAYVGRVEKSLRITFDKNIRMRSHDLDLRLGSAGETIPPEGGVLMEIKSPYAAPLWLAGLLAEEAVFPTSFSKSGIGYKTYLIGEFLNTISFPDEGR